MNSAKKTKIIAKVKHFIVALFRYLLLIGFSYYILSPLILKLCTSFMTEEDMIDKLVKYVPRTFTLINYQTVAKELGYWKALGNTVLLSTFCAVIQMMVCTFIGYGLAKFNFKGRGLVIAVVILSIITPPTTYQASMYLKFRYFDIAGIFQLIRGSKVNLLNSLWPFGILSFTGYAFKNGIFIYMMRQFFRGFPDELEEAAYVDGSGVFKTFFTIILPNSVSMMFTVFMLVFAWQWTDTFYTTLFFGGRSFKTLSYILSTTGLSGIIYPGKTVPLAAGQTLTVGLTGTFVLMIIFPLIIIYAFGQKTITEGIETSGIVG